MKGRLVDLCADPTRGERWKEERRKKGTKNRMQMSGSDRRKSARLLRWSTRVKLDAKPAKESFLRKTNFKRKLFDELSGFQWRKREMRVVFSPKMLSVTRNATVEADKRNKDTHNLRQQAGEEITSEKLLNYKEQPVARPHLQIKCV